MVHGTRKLYQCGGCRFQTSLTASNLMEHTKLPLTTWFMAIHLISQAKTGISALALKLDMVSGFTSDGITKLGKASLLPKTIVTSDGLGCVAAVTQGGCIRMPRLVGAQMHRDLPEFKWINTLLGKLKAMMSGAFKAL